MSDWYPERAECDFTTHYGEIVDTQPLLDAIEEETKNLWLAIMWKVWEAHKWQVKRDIERLLELKK